MRKLVAVMAVGLLGLTLLALMPSLASAELKTSITGNIRLNAHYTDVISNTGTAEEIAPTGLPYTAGFRKSREADNNQTMIDARRTRLQAVVSDEVGMTKLSAFFQGDFDTADGNAVTSNARHFRMRLAWAQGQTPTGWILRAGQMRTIVSEFGDNLFGGVGAPDIVDENGHWDQLQGRQPGVQVAYSTKFMGGDLLVGVGVEKAGVALTDRSRRTSNTCFSPIAGEDGDVFDSASCPGGFVPVPALLVTGGGSSTAVNVDQGTGQDVPMVGAAVRYRTPLWAVFVRGAAQKQRVIMNVDPSVDPEGGMKQGNATALTGWLGAITAEVTPGPLTVYGQYWYGEGLNRLGGVFSDVVLGGGDNLSAATGRKLNNIRHLRPITTHNWHAGAEYKLTKELKAVAVYEYTGAIPNRKLFDLRDTTADKNKFQAVHAGLSYTFWTRFNFGLEYQWGKVDSFGSSEGTMNAINSRLHFYF